MRSNQLSYPAKSYGNCGVASKLRVQRYDEFFNLPNFFREKCKKK